MNDDIIIIDDVIPKDYSDHIKNLMTGWDFGWVFNQNMVSPDAELQGESNHAGFNHFFYEKQQAVSQHFNFIYPLVLSITSASKTPYNRLIRMRANLTLPNKTSTLEYHMPHIDSFFEHWNAIYYVNDCDGDTIIFNETNDTYDPGTDDIMRIKENKFTIKERVTPKQGRVVVFPGKYYHTSSYCKDSAYRSVININLDRVQLG